MFVGDEEGSSKTFEAACLTRAKDGRGGFFAFDPYEGYVALSTVNLEPFISRRIYLNCRKMLFVGRSMILQARVLGAVCALNKMAQHHDKRSSRRALPEISQRAKHVHAQLVKINIRHRPVLKTAAF